MSGVEPPGVSIEPLASDAEAANKHKEIDGICKCVSSVADWLASCGYQASARMLQVQVMHLRALEGESWK